jgi:hypothetical protein
VKRRLATFARCQPVVILLSAVLPLVLRALLLPWIPAPQPRVQDEFAHLLVADTFAHGRLVNPVHPMWVHFESMHILVRPVYASVFPVGQGIAMAAGAVIFGHPWAGVWIGMALMCAAVSWMLYGWLPPRWALFGSAMVVLRFAVLSYWMNSYYGGALAAAGGALALGALPRIHRHRRWQDAAIFAAGLAILANTRPYEGALLGAPLFAAVAWTLRRGPRRLAVVVPLVLILGATAAAMASYNARFSGNPLQLPYAFYRAHFTQAPHFVFQQARPEPRYLHRVLHDFHAIWEMGCYEDARANRAPHGLASKAFSYWRFYLGPLLALPFLTLPWMVRRGRVRALLLLAAIFAAGLAIEVWHAPHYAAPALGLAMLLTLQALRQVRALAGPWPARVLAAGCLLIPVIGGSSVDTSGQPRARVLAQLAAAGGRHLVIVRYGRLHDVGDEWVYNAANIDAAPVVWAREMDPTSNQELLRYFHDRRVWLLEPDLSRPVLTPYDPANAPDPPFRFLKLGTPEITVLRSPAELREKLRGQAANSARPCDEWNYLFTQTTGVEAPDPARGCFAAGNRGAPLTFDRWFAWLESLDR